MIKLISKMLWKTEFYRKFKIWFKNFILIVFIGSSGVQEFININISNFSFPKDDNEIRAVATNKGAKKYFCVYCKKLYCKLVPHLEKAHGNESDVLEFCRLPKGKFPTFQLRYLNMLLTQHPLQV